MRKVLASRPFSMALVMALLLSALALVRRDILLTQAPFDVFMPLDAGLRWLAGLRPSLDYPSPIGPLYAAVNGLAMRLGGVTAGAVMQGNVIVLMLCLVLLAPVLRGMPAMVRWAVPVILAGMLLLPLDLDAVPPDYRYVTNYNNWAWAFFAVLAAWTLRSGPGRRVDDLAAGLALLCLFYLKLSVFVFALPLMALGLLLERRRADYILPLVLVAAGIGLDAVLGHLWPYLQDNIATARATGSARPQKLSWQVFALFNAPATLALMLILYRQLGPRPQSQPGQAKVTAILLAAWLLFNLAALQNHDKLIPVISLPLLLMAPYLPAGSKSWARIPAVIHAALLMLAVVIGFAAQPLVAEAVHAAPLGRPGTLGADIHLSAMRGLGDWRAPALGDSLPHTDEMVHVEFQSLEDLLDGRGGAGLALEFSNAALAAWPAVQPAPHAPLWYDINRSFSAQIFTAPESAFRGLNLVLLPKRHRTDNTRALAAIYQPWLDRCMVMAGENELWRLYLPRPGITCP